MALEVFKKYSKDDLLHIAAYRQMPVAAEMIEDPAKDIAKLLADDVSTSGLELLMSALSKPTLFELSKHWKLEYPTAAEKAGKAKQTKKPQGKQKETKSKAPATPTAKVMAKRLGTLALEKGGKTFFSSSEPCLESIVEDLDLEVTGKDKDKAVKAIMAEAEIIGVENCLSAFDFDKLKDFAENSGLKVYGRSREKLMGALMDRKNMEKPDKKPAPKAPKVSKDKPKIAKGITAVDLNSWYYAKELVEWLEGKSLPSKGVKKELVKRILDHLAGKDVTKPKEKKEKKKAATKTKKVGTKRKASEKEGSGSASEGEKSAEEEKPPKKKAKTTA